VRTWVQQSAVEGVWPHLMRLAVGFKCPVGADMGWCVTFSVEQAFGALQLFIFMDRALDTECRRFAVGSPCARAFARRRRA